MHSKHATFTLIWLKFGPPSATPNSYMYISWSGGGEGGGGGVGIVVAVAFDGIMDLLSFSALKARRP